MRGGGVGVGGGTGKLHFHFISILMAFYCWRSTYWQPPSIVPIADGACPVGVSYSRDSFEYISFSNLQHSNGDTSCLTVCLSVHPFLLAYPVVWIDVRVLINEIINIILRRLCRSPDKIVDCDDFIWDAKVAVAATEHMARIVIKFVMMIMMAMMRQVLRERPQRCN